MVHSIKIIPILSLCALQLFAQSESRMQPEARQVAFGGLRARSIGPAVMSGRVSDVVGVDSKPEIFYVGAANGGVWKTVSGGASFRPIFDDFPQSIGKLAIDQKHPDTVWAGTGEPWVRNSVSVGTGIYVTKNGGNSWDFKGLPNSEHIANIAIDPNTPTTIYVAVQGHLWDANEDRGVYKSTDFGTTWQKILYVDANTGAADLAMDPTNSNILYAAMWEHRRSPDFFSSGGTGSGLYKTTDGGAHWNKIQNGFPEGMLGRIGIGVAPSNPKTIYISVEAEKKADKGIYKSLDAGASWKKMNGDFNATVRPFYFSRLVVDPTDEKKVIKGGLQGIISEDGGNTFRQINGVHSDMHAFWFNPQNPKNIILGCDGGAYYSLDYGQSFFHLMNLPLSQLYMVSVDDEDPYNIYGGLQDNNSWYGPSTSATGVKNQDWQATSGGDGFYAFRHPTDKNIVYSESQEGEITRYNKQDGTQKNIKPISAPGEPDLRFNWNTPIAVSPNNPERMYLGSQYLFKTENRGDSWTKISPDLTTNDPKRQNKKSGGLSPDWSGAETNTTIVTMAESPKDENVIWAGTDDGFVQVTTDGGKKWSNVTGNIPNLPKGLWVSFVEPGHFDKSVCYVTVDGHRSGDKKAYAYKTTDLGKTWKSMTTADVDAYAACIREDIKNPDLLFLGTEFGLFISIDAGVSWKRYTNNLPKTEIAQMVIHPREDALVMATHGRGIYIIDDISPLRQLTKEAMEKDFFFFDNKPFVKKLETGSTSFGGAGNFDGEPADRSNVKIYYYQRKRQTVGDMTAQIIDGQGNVIKEIPTSKSVGVNLLLLPVNLPQPKTAPTTNLEAVTFGTPSLPEGTYTVKIKKADKEYTTQFSITAPTNFPYSAEDRAIQYRESMKGYDQTGRMAYVFYMLQNMHRQASALKIEDPKLAKQVADFAKETEAYKKTLASTDGDYYIADEKFLREDISRFYGGVVGFPGRPSDTQIQLGNYLEKKLVAVEARFNEYVKKMNNLNELLVKAGKTPLKIKTLKEYINEK